MIRLEAKPTVTDARKISHMLKYETSNGFKGGGGERSRGAKDRLCSQVSNQDFR